MPHAVYFVPFIVCPWTDCDFSIEVVDFRLEHFNDSELYRRAVSAWMLSEDYGLTARCPGCGRFVWFGKRSKHAITKDLEGEVLPDHWHTIAELA